MIVGSKYDQHLEFVQANLTTLGFDLCAKKIGVTTPALKRQITSWRYQGIDIPFLRTVPVGTIRTRTDDGIVRKFIKTESGWQRIGRVTPYKEGGEKKARQEKRKKTAEPRLLPKPKPEVVRLPNRVIDMTKHQFVKVDNKTWKLKKIA